MATPRTAALFGLLLTACADASPAPLTLHEQAVVYGADDRRELYELPPDAQLRALARSVAAVIPRAALTQGSAGEPLLLGHTLEQTFEVCADQPFAKELGAAVCTAFLIDDTLLATAGHCFNYALDCQNYVFVFDYVHASRSAPVAISAQNIYECRRTRVRVDEMEPGVWKHDYAIVELARPVEGRAPLPVRSEPIVLGEAVNVISAVSGLPLKVDRGARVLDARAHMNDFFRLDSDTAYGSSGAPVFDADGLLVGITVRGRRDYVLDEQAGCYVENVLPPPELVPPGERVMFPGPNELYSEEANPLAPALAALCDLSYPSPRLCGREPSCGDEICSGDESFEDCPDDCAEPPPESAAIAPMDDASEDEVADASAEARGARRSDAGCALAAAPPDAWAPAWLLPFACGLGRLGRGRRQGECKGRDARKA
jgi:hypothetical protein